MGCVYGAERARPSKRKNVATGLRWRRCRRRPQTGIAFVRNERRCAVRGIGELPVLEFEQELAIWDSRGGAGFRRLNDRLPARRTTVKARSEEHTSELQSPDHL